MIIFFFAVPTLRAAPWCACPANGEGEGGGRNNRPTRERQDIFLLLLPTVLWTVVTTVELGTCETLKSAVLVVLQPVLVAF